MFNSTQIKLGSNSQTVQFNTPSSGMLQRSHPKSFFLRFAKGSTLEKWIFDEKPYSNIDEYGRNKTLVTVLQIMVFGDIQYLCEVVKNEDLELNENNKQS